jgi:hypothetical protein
LRQGGINSRLNIVIKSGGGKSIIGYLNKSYLETVVNWFLKVAATPFGQERQVFGNLWVAQRLCFYLYAGKIMN